MFKQSESKQENSTPKEETPVSSKPLKPSQSSTPSIIGADVRLKGNLATSGEVQFDGAVEGDLRCGSLTVGESAEINGGIMADLVIVHGTVRGTIRAKKVRLEQSSKVIGDIWHEDLAIASGSHIEGHCMRVDNALEDSGSETKLSSKALEAAKQDTPKPDAGTSTKAAE